MTENYSKYMPVSKLKARRTKPQNGSGASQGALSANSSISFRNPGKRFKSDSGSSGGDKNGPQDGEEMGDEVGQDTPVLPTMKTLAASDNRLHKLFRRSLDEWSSAQCDQRQKNRPSNFSQQLSQIAEDSNISLRDAALEAMGILTPYQETVPTQVKVKAKKSQF